LLPRAAPPAMAGAEDDDENVIIEKDDEGNTWVIDLNSAVVMRKPAGANAELAVVGRWIDGAVVLNEELRGATKGEDAAAVLAAASPPAPAAPPLKPPLSPDAMRALRERGWVVVDGVLDVDVASATREELRREVVDADGGRAMTPMFRERGADGGRSDAVAWLEWRGGVGGGVEGGGARGVAAPPLAKAAVATLAAAAAQLSSARESRLRVPNVAQLGVYRGVGAKYERHLDNVRTPVRVCPSRGALVSKARALILFGRPSRYPRRRDGRDAPRPTDASVPFHPRPLPSSFVRRQSGWYVNARAYTAILYLNSAWDAAARGGSLRLHDVVVDDDDRSRGGGGGGGGEPSRRVVDVDPRGGRLVIFDSREVAHEVTPLLGRSSGSDGGGADARYAITLWVLDPSVPVDGATR